MSGYQNGAWGSLLQRSSEMRDLGLEDLRVDMRFQRAINPHSLERIKAEYHPNGIGHILVAGVQPVNSGEPRYAVIDGQTRYRALCDLIEDQREGKEVPTGLSQTIRAEVFPDLSVPEAALLFRLRNTQKPVPPVDRSRIAVIEGDPEMRTVVEQSLEAGYVVFSDNESIIATMEKGVEEARRIVRWGVKYDRPKLLAEALTIQAEAFRNPDSPDLRGTIHPKILQATADLLRKNPNLVEAELSRVMRTMNDLLFDSEKIASKDRIRLHKAIQIVLRERYNKGKGKAERIKV
jgi:hypothetical protein